MHDYLIKKTIRDVTQGIPIKCKEFFEIWKADTKENEEGSKKPEQQNESKKLKAASTKPSKKGKKEKKGKGATALNVQISGEIYFTDPSLSVHHLIQRDRDVCDGYIFLSVNSLMTRMQKFYMNPLVINLVKIRNLPVDVLNKHG